MLFLILLDIHIPFMNIPHSYKYSSFLQKNLTLMDIPPSYGYFLFFLDIPPQLIFLNLKYIPHSYG